MGKDRRDRRLHRLRRRIRKRPHETNKHHLVAESRGGNKEAKNILMINVWKHECWHFLFKNRTIDEIIAFLRSYPTLPNAKPEEWKILFRKNSINGAIEILERIKKLKRKLGPLCIARDEHRMYSARVPKRRSYNLTTKERGR